MNRVHPGRFTADVEGDFVVFLIGMRINKLWKVHKRLPVAVAMPRMLRYLDRNPQDGLLGYRSAGGIGSATGRPTTSPSTTPTSVAVVSAVCEGR